MIKVSRPLKELAYKAYQCKEKLQETLGREPTITEISETMEVPVEDLTMAMEAGAMWNLCKNPFIKRMARKYV